MGCAVDSALARALDKLDAATDVVERLRSVPWVAQPAVTVQPNRAELDETLAKLRGYIVDAANAIAAEMGRRT